MPARRCGRLEYMKRNNKEARQRLFFALWPPEPVAKGLHDWAKAVHAKAEAARAGSGGRVTRESTIHLTLAFLGDVPGDRVEPLVECGRRVRAAPIELELDEGRWWEHNRIVWAGPRAIPEGLRDLAAQLGGALQEAGFSTEEREFRAHVTLVRRASLGADGLPPFEPVAWRAEEFVLVRSTLAPHGPAYETLARFALAGTKSG